MRCPHCRSTLRPLQYEGIEIETCPSCKGEWVDAKELGHIVRTREVRFDEHQRRAIAESTTITGVKLNDVDRDLHCPKCDGTTDSVNYGGDTGIIIDKCTECGGIWLDAGELEKIQKVVEGWDDQLPDDLVVHRQALADVSRDVDRKDDFGHARFGFLNAAINGILDIAR